MKAFLVLGVLLTSAMLTDGHLSAGDKGPPKPTLPKGTPGEQVNDLIAQHEKASAAFRKSYLAAKTEEEQEKLEALFPDPRPYADLLMQIAEKNPGDSATVDALIWAHDNARSSKAKEILIRDHLLHSTIGPFCWSLSRENDTETFKALKKVLTENPSKEVQAHAAVALGMRLRSSAALARKIQKADGNATAKWEENLGREVVADLKKADSADLEKEAEDLFARVTMDKAHAQLTIPFGGDSITLGELAGRELFQMRYLQPGQAAPDIVGEDIDGKPMKLSDFRGKVILLDFWATWCGPCMVMNEHGRSLVKKFAGKPFVIIGVNCDTDRAKVRELSAEKGPPWRSFWDGGINGPIQNQWNIKGLPTVYLIDHQGIIVGQTAPIGEGAAQIERTVNEAESVGSK